MNASAARFNLVTAQSPSVDRRSLSQAWYSALHIASQKSLAGREPPARSARGRSAIVCHPERRRAKRAAVEGQRNGGKVAVVPRLRASTTPYARDDKRITYARHDTLERRARPSALAKAILEKIKSNTAATRFLIESPRGRVIIHIVRRDGRVHLAAICGAAVGAEVEKALAQARFALAGMGVSVR